MKYGKFIFSAVLLCASAGNAAIEISSDREMEQVNQARSEFESALELHRDRKVGIGLAAGGPAGVMGGFLQFHFALDVGVNIGYGFGKGFNSFNLGFRNFLGSGAINPYWGLSYARWMGQGENLEDGSSTKLLTEKFLSGREKRSGEFSENLIYPSLGIQLYKMSGDWAGAAFFAEISYLVDMEDFVAGATGSLGFVRYF